MTSANALRQEHMTSWRNYRKTSVSGVEGVSAGEVDEVRELTTIWGRWCWCLEAAVKCFGFILSEMRSPGEFGPGTDDVSSSYNAVNQHLQHCQHIKNQIPYSS